MLRGQRPAVWFRVVVNLRAARKEAECISHAVPAQYPRDNMAGQGHERGGAGAHRQQVDVSNAEGQEAAVARPPSQNARRPAAKRHPV